MCRAAVGAGFASVRRVGKVWPAVFLALALPVSGSSGQGQEPRQGDGEAFPVTMAAEAGAPDGEGRQRIVVTLTIRKPYWIFANPVGQQDLEGFRPRVTVTGKNKPRGVKVTYPKGEVVEDKVVGDYRVSRGKVRIEAVVERLKNDAEPLLVAVRLRPFDEVGCRWPTRSLEQTIP